MSNHELRDILRSERGSEAIEAVIGVPAFLLFVVFIVAGGRVAMAHNSVDAAATDAARTASISRTKTTAAHAATTSAKATLANQSLQCVSMSVTVDTSGFAKPPGQPASVSATVTCRVNLSDLTMPGLPGTITITRTMSSPIDTYREREK